MSISCYFFFSVSFLKIKVLDKYLQYHILTFVYHTLVIRFVSLLYLRALCLSHHSLFSVFPWYSPFFIWHALFDCHFQLKNNHNTNDIFLNVVIQWKYNMIYLAILLNINFDIEIELGRCRSLHCLLPCIA